MTAATTQTDPTATEPLAPNQAQNAGDATPAGADGADADPQPVIVNELAEFSENLKSLIEEPSWGNAVSTFLPVLLEVGRIIFIVVVLLLIVSFISRWAQKAVGKALERPKMDLTLKRFFVRLTKYVVWILAIPVALSVLGVQATSLAAVIGAAGIAIGLGLQGALANISAGILLLMLRPVRVGDFVVIQGEWGEVRELGLFYATINTFANEVVSIPNQQILSDKVQNLTGNTTRRVEIEIGVAYGTDLRVAEQALLEAANSVESRVKEIEPRVWLAGFGDSSIDFLVHLHCPARSFFGVRHHCIHAINDALAKADIEIPFPQRTISGNLRVVRDEAD
ncbi:MAG: mechanosensitive ion channel family protein [Phycisphaerales bacterium]|nr:mechanosensitive ion channel family protein [Planctomycetota bacterium]MCH8508504.1 mechanosensitive ion channel family protein [Phycisphaerales bacterium]